MHIDGTGTERTFCGRHKISECEDLGEITPSTQMCSPCSEMCSLCSGKIFADPDPWGRRCKECEAQDLMRRCLRVDRAPQRFGCSRKKELWSI